MGNLFPKKRVRIRKTFHNEIKILSVCLMPNHFHLLIHQNSSSSMAEFVQSVCTAYSMYFNKKYNRVGSLFQGVYKAVIVTTDEYLLHLSRYIHRNPLSLTGSHPGRLSEYPYSSFSTYLDPNQRSWINTQIIHEYFSGNKPPTLQYKNFVEMLDEKEVPEIARLLIEDD